MTGHWTLALLLTALALMPRTASAGPAGDPGPDQIATNAAPAWIASYPASAGAGLVLRSPAQNDELCLTCHGDSALSMRFANGAALSLHVDASGLRDSAHGQMECVTCHVGLDTHPDPAVSFSSPADYEARAVKTCLNCHASAAAGYADSAHGVPVLASTGSGATCNDCHSPNGSGHSTTRLASLDGGGMAASVTENCGRCHASALASYRRTNHGQLVAFADSRRAATCADCHGAHAVKAVGADVVGLAPAGLTVVCQKCHQSADQQFAGEWRGHEASVSPTGLANFTRRGVLLLMAAGVCFGVCHVALDVMRNPRHPGGGPT
jgi:hypothetical protein